jgi:hypothetical protein
MINLNNILKLFHSKYEISQSESFTTFTISFSCVNNLPVLDFENLLITNINADTLKITLYANETTCQFSSTEGFKNDAFFNLLQELEDNDDFKIKLDIVKDTPNKYVNIYSLDSISIYLNSLNFQERLDLFNKFILLNNGFLLFLSNEISESYTSGRIAFIPYLSLGNEASQINDINVANKIEKINSLTRFVGINNYKITPLDFYISDFPNPSIQKIFDEICLVTLLGTLFDFTSIEDNKIYTKLAGYRNFDFEIETNVLELTSLKTYKNIFNWVFETNNVNDKIGLSRNIISLNLKEGNGYTVNDTAIDSIKSAFEIYEKQNVKQYIELRNKISDQILSYNEKANKIIESFASNFQKSVLGFISLFSTIVITRVLTNKNFENIFTYDSMIITLIFLVASLIYMLISVWEVNAQRDRYKLSYQNMKKRNEDLLTINDIKKILNDDTEYKVDIKFIENKKCYYTFFWIILIIVFGIAVIVLHNPKKVSKVTNMSNVNNRDSVKKTINIKDTSKYRK